jgi:hypothetical protein
MKRPSSISTLRLPAAAVPKGRPEDEVPTTLLEALARNIATAEGHHVLRTKAGARGVVLDCYLEGELYRMRVWVNPAGETKLTKLIDPPAGLIPREE